MNYECPCGMSTSTTPRGTVCGNCHQWSDIPCASRCYPRDMRYASPALIIVVAILLAVFVHPLLALLALLAFFV